MEMNGANEAHEIHIERVLYVQEQLEHQKNRRGGAAKLSCLEKTFQTPHAAAFDACCFMLIEMILLKAGFTHCPKDALIVLETMVVSGRSAASLGLCSQAFFDKWKEVRTGRNSTTTQTRWAHRFFENTASLLISTLTLYN